MEDFAPFKIAKKLKDKGYPKYICDYAYIIKDDEEENYTFEDREYVSYIPDYLPTIASPTIEQVLKWLREEKNMYIEMFLYNRTYSYFVKSITKISEDYHFHQCLNKDTTAIEYETYEDAALAGIEYVIDNLI